MWTFNVSLPKFKINLKQEDRPAEKTRQQTADIAKKISRISHDEAEEERHHSQPQDISHSFISTIIKKQAQEKIAEKEKKQKVTINFSGEKPKIKTKILKSN